MPVFLYWKNVGKYTALFLLSWAGADGILRLFPLFDPFGGYVAWTLYAIYSSTIFLAIFIPLFYLFSDGIRHLLRRIQSRISS